MAGNKALKRAALTSDAIRVDGNVPLIVDTTELIDPAKAHEMLQRNKSNRPVNWKKVEEYAAIMARGEWKLHAQGIIIDTCGNLLTGQKRLWAVIYSNSAQYFRVSRGNPAEVAKLLDRGTPQSARDLASRDTERKHSPTEASIARAVCAIRGILKPSTDELAEVIARQGPMVQAIFNEIKGTKKSKSVVMACAAICERSDSIDDARRLARQIDLIAGRLDMALLPQTAASCWGKGAAFSLAMGHALKSVQSAT